MGVAFVLGVGLGFLLGSGRAWKQASESGEGGARLPIAPLVEAGDDSAEPSPVPVRTLLGTESATASTNPTDDPVARARDLLEALRSRGPQLLPPFDLASVRQLVRSKLYNPLGLDTKEIEKALWDGMQAELAQYRNSEKHFRDGLSGVVKEMASAGPFALIPKNPDGTISGFASRLDSQAQTMQFKSPATGGEVVDVTVDMAEYPAILSHQETRNAIARAIDPRIRETMIGMTLQALENQEKAKGVSPNPAFLEPAKGSAPSGRADSTERASPGELQRLGPSTDDRVEHAIDADGERGAEGRRRQDEIGPLARARSRGPARKTPPLQRISPSFRELGAGRCARSYRRM